MKSNALMNLTGTNEQVGPATYPVGKLFNYFKCQKELLKLRFIIILLNGYYPKEQEKDWN